MNIYYILAIVCSIGTMVFTYLASQKDGEQTEKNLKSTIEKQSKEIKELSQQNIKLSDVIHTNTKELTAKGSFPSTILGGGADNGNKTQLTVLLNGNYAIPNLTVRVVVIPNYPNVSGLDLNTLGILNPTTEIGTLRKSEGRSYMIETKAKYTAVLLFFNSDNNSWNESVRIVKTENGRKVMRYIQNGEGAILQKFIDEGFPVDKSGNITIWSNLKQKFAEI